MIDGLRGLGAVSIALYHIFRYGPLPAAAEPLMPTAVSTAIDNGWMAVQWFFVIAGLGSALATQSHVPGLRDAPRHVLRRVLRLGPAYWVTIALTAILTIIAIRGWDDHSLNEASPTLPQFLAHLGFVQDILGYDCLTTGIWFIAIALQLEIAFIGLLAVAKFASDWVGQQGSAFPREGILIVCFAPLTLWSLFVSIRESSTDIWFHHFFCLFMLGALIGWTMSGRIRARWFWIYVAIMVGQCSWQFSKEVLIALIAGLTIYGAWRGQRLQTWLNWPSLQYLGRISYSLFLIHYPTSWLVGRCGYQLTGDHPAAALGWLILGLVASIGAAHLLYTFVERPMLDWARLVGRTQSSANATTPPGASA